MISAKKTVRLLNRFALITEKKCSVLQKVWIFFLDLGTFTSL